MFLTVERKFITNISHGNKRRKEENLHRINHEITALEVRCLLGETSESLGILKLADALLLAEKKGLDLVEIAPTAKPPVCKIIDYGKFKYSEQREADKIKAKQKVVEIKEIKFRPATGEADYLVKLKNIKKFILEGDKCKISVRFKGREITHQEFGMNVLTRLQADLAGTIVIEQQPKLEGRQLLMVIGPEKKKPTVKASQ